MKWIEHHRWTRAGLLRAALIAPAAALLAACTGRNNSGSSVQTGAGTPGAPAVSAGATAAARESAASTPAQPPITQILQPTPACGDDDDPTPAQTEGPYFTPNSPERSSLIEPGISGTRLVVSGFVVTTTCQPIAGALVDFWQCDDRGVYDNTGYRLRGHQFTDDQGRYELETILPGVYPGRTRHIHVKVQAPNQPVLTTQQYFPNEPGNARDGIYRRDLEMDVKDTPDGKVAAFTYVLAVR
jgi:protocatechuate 3,4-dioxygenase beta subunit